MTEEIFGPILPILAVDGPDEQVAKEAQSVLRLIGQLVLTRTDAERRLAARVRGAHHRVRVTGGPPLHDGRPAVAGQ